MKLFTFLLFMADIVKQQETKTIPCISNGTKPIIVGRELSDATDPDDLPFMVEMRVFGDTRCFGAYLGGKWILIPASCYRNENHWTLIFQDKLQATGLVFLDQAYGFGLYKGTPGLNDVALVKMTGVGPEGEKPICLPRNTQSFEGLKCIVADTIFDKGRTDNRSQERVPVSIDSRACTGVSPTMTELCVKINCTDHPNAYPSGPILCHVQGSWTVAGLIPYEGNSHSTCTSVANFSSIANYVYWVEKAVRHYS